MADVKNVVTLGIGASPGGLVWFITTGLESGAVVATPGTPVILTVPYENRTLDVPQESRTLIVPVRRSVP